MRNDLSPEYFRCQMCGMCCSRIRGKVDPKDLEFLNKNAFGAMPMFQLVSLKQSSFPLWDWEAERFRSWQKEAGIDAKIRPSRAIYDLNTSRTIIITYFMDSDSCPFLKSGACLIYDKPRAFVCRLFPFQRTPFLDIDEDSVPKDLLGTCRSLEGIIPSIPKEREEMIKWLDRYFKDGSFENAVQNDLTTAWINRMIVNLCKGRHIRPAINYPYDKLLKRANNSPSIDLTNFLVEVGVCTRAEIDEAVTGFDTNRGAKEMLQHYR